MTKDAGKETIIKLLDFAPDPSAPQNYQYDKIIEEYIVGDYPKIKNIALEGDYGSGKSSVLERLLNNRKIKDCYKPIVVSFLSFDPDSYAVPLKRRKENEEEGAWGEETRESVLDRKIQTEIVKQLFYGEKANRTKWSGFSRIGMTYPIKIFFLSIALSILIELLVFRSNIISWSTLAEIILLTIAFSIVIGFTSNIIGRISSFSAKDISIVLNDDKPDFDQMTDFLLNFFKNTGHRVVIFEDIDRFENERIFESIRQLNILINQSELIDERVVFIYAIKGNTIKESASRAKLFDVIIPIVPFMSSENAERLFKEMLLSDSNLLLSQSHVVAEVSNYISDIRVLKNIINNYKMVTKIFGVNDGNAARNCMALSIVKVLYPEEFSRLLRSKGYINCTIEECKEAKAEKLREIENGSAEEEYYIANKDLFFALLTNGGNTDGLQISRVLIDGNSINYSDIDIYDAMASNAITVYRGPYPNSGRLYSKNEIQLAKEKIDDSFNDLKKRLEKELEEEKRKNILHYYDSKKEAINKAFIERNGLDGYDINKEMPALHVLLAGRLMDERITHFIYESRTKDDSNDVDYFIYNGIRLNRLSTNYPTSAIIGRLLDELSEADMYMPGIYNNDLIIDIVSRHKKDKKIDAKYKALLNGTKNNSNYFKIFAINYFSERNSSASENKLIYELLKDVGNRYPDLVLSIAIGISNSRQNAARIVFNQLLADKPLFDIESLDDSEKVILEDVGYLIAADNISTYFDLVKKIGASISNLYDYRMDLNELESKLRSSMQPIRFNKKTVRHLSSEFIVGYMDNGIVTDDDLNNIMRTKKDLIGNIANNIELIKRCSLRQDTMIDIYNTAYSKKCRLEPEVLEYASGFMNDDWIVGEIVLNEPENNTITTMMSSSKNGNLNKIVNSGRRIELDNNETNRRFKQLLMDRGLVKHMRSSDNKLLKMMV